MGTAVRTLFSLILGMLVGAAVVVGYLETHPALLPGGEARRPAFQDEDLLADLYERVSPSVVNITVRTQRAGSGNLPEFEQGTGSGIILDTHGNILTNNHVVG